MTMDRCYLHCNINSLDPSIFRSRQPISALMWRFVSTENNASPKMRAGDRNVLVHLVQCSSWFLRTPVIFWQTIGNTSSTNIRGRYAPLGRPILSFSSLFTPTHSAGENVLCLKWKEMSWGVPKCMDCLCLIASLWCKGLFSCLFGAYHLLLVCLIINNAGSTLPTQQTPKWRQPALQILRMRKVTWRSTLNLNKKTTGNAWRGSLC